ncbi:type III endosome membrane protein TEMP-like isoform X2 [Triplophysa dalaica]|nr:type III endosome membrane protein TEMP-like isoform X2 [Triplophysa dalaica]
MDIIGSAELEKSNGTYPSTGFRSTWPSVLGTVIAVLSIALMIAVAVKYHLFKSCQLRNSHELLLEGDRDSQYSHAGALEGGVAVRGMRGRMIDTSEDNSGEDDDGFIEDNYIQASEREDYQEDVEDTDDELIISESDIE